MNTANLKRHRTFVLSLAVAALGIAGCRTAPNPQPFKQYSVAVKTVADGMDQALGQNITWSRDRYILSVLDGSVGLSHTAILDRQGPFTATFPVAGGTTNEPIFYKLQEVRQTLLNLNAATEQYVDLLAQLAGSELVDPASFEAIAKDTDASLNAIAQRLDQQVPGNAIHVFSIGSTEIMQLVIEKKRHDALVKILRASQPGIDDYCAKCISLLRILDESLANEYNANAFAIAGRFADIPKDKRATDPKARQAVEQLLQLNSDYLLLVRSLSSAERVYEELPKGHHELLTSLQKKSTGFEAIKGLYEEGKRLQGIYDALNQPTASAGTKGWL